MKEIQRNVCKTFLKASFVFDYCEESKGEKYF